MLRQGLFILIALLISGEGTLLKQMTDTYIHMESPHWDEVTESLYAVDQLVGWVLKYTPATGNLTRVFLGSGLVSPILTIEGSRNTFIAGRGQQLVSFEWDGISETPANVRVVATLEANRPDFYIYGGKADSRGRIWLGTTDVDESGDGGLYLVEPVRNFTATKKLSVGRVTGIEWNNEDDVMYLIDAATKNITQHSFDSSTANIGEGEFLFRLKDYRIGGVTIDNSPQLWYTVSVDFGAGFVANVNLTNNQSNTFMDLSPLEITNAAWGGAAMDCLFVTTSKVGLTEGQLGFYVGSGALWGFTETGLTGRPPYKVKL